MRSGNETKHSQTIPQVVWWGVHPPPPLPPRSTDHTRVNWRQKSCAEHGEDGKWALCMHTMCVHAPHTHVWRTAKLSEKTHKHRIHPCFFRKPGCFINFVLNISKKKQPWNNFHTNLITTTNIWITATAANTFQLRFIQPIGSSALHSSICACTTLGLTCAHNQANRVSGVDSTNVYPGVLSDTPTECVTQCANVQSLKQTTDNMQTMH